MNAPVIHIRNLSFSYGQQRVLENIDMDIHPGDYVAVVGPNGGGKTTLVRLILGLIKPTAGIITVFGQTPSSVRHRIGYVPQNVDINRRFPISVREVVMMGNLRAGGRRVRFTESYRARAHGALETVGMSAYVDRRIGELSGGQRQRVFIARALVSSPEMMILDEPTASIDNKGQKEFYDTLKTLNDNRMTVVVISHDLSVLSPYVKSVACVNRHLHHHRPDEVRGDLIGRLRTCSVEQLCPVAGIFSHSIAHPPPEEAAATEEPS